MNTTELSCAFMGYIYDESPTYKATLITIASFMLVLSLPTFFINTCIMIAIFWKSELHTPSFAVILNLAISDCLAGCSAYIFYATTSIRFASGYDACPVAYIGTPWSHILAITSFNTIALQTIERYIAIFFPYWYHEKVSMRRIIVACLSTWLSSIALVTIWLITKDNRIFYGILGFLSITLFVVTVTAYFRIFREVRRIEKEMMTHQTASYEDRKKIKSESKVAKATVIILVVVITCYSPALFFDFYFAFIGKKTKSASIGLYWAWLLALSNSFVSPLIACRQLTMLRKPVKRIALRMFPCHKTNDVTSLTSTTSFVVSKTSVTEINLEKMWRNVISESDIQQFETEKKNKTLMSHR